MGLETATTIEELVSSNPDPSDNVSQGDDHLRLIKEVLKTTFPGSGGAGFNGPILATEDELNGIHGIGGSASARKVYPQITTKPLVVLNTTAQEIFRTNTIAVPTMIAGDRVNTVDMYFDFWNDYYLGVKPTVDVQYYISASFVIDGVEDPIPFHVFSNYASPGDASYISNRISIIGEIIPSCADFAIVFRQYVLSTSYGTVMQFISQGIKTNIVVTSNVAI